MIPVTREAYQLLHDGALTLAHVEHNGIRIDTDRMDQTINETKNNIGRLIGELRNSKVWDIWKKKYVDKAKIGSRAQLGSVLFKELGYDSGARTRTGRNKVDEKVLMGIDHPFVKKWLEVEKLKKALSTYLMGIRREVVDGFLHPSFNLHLVRTYRSSSDAPNFQNIPIRDKEIGKLIRTCFIPRDGCVLVETDFSALEVCIAACYHRDPRMIRYIKDPSSDMHRDMACECFLLKPEQVSKDIRFYAKGGFVFPEFYGSYYIQVAPDLWNAIDRGKLTLADTGESLRDHLSYHGIDELGACNPKERPLSGTFEKHIQQVEKEFWGNRFPVYAQWRKKWYEQYVKSGGFTMFTGFRVDGVYSRNDVINYPVQGAAFHCLLWSLIRLVREIKRRRMKTKVVGQIHDSILADVPHSEMDDYTALVKQTMTVDLPKTWTWIIVPLKVEIEVAETNWFEKREVA